jgi:hypothetical protein
MKKNKLSSVIILLLSYITGCVMVSGCATTTTKPASIEDVNINIPRINFEQSPVIAIRYFEMNNIPNEIGSIIGKGIGGLLKQRFANVKFENRKQAEISLAEALIVLLRNSNYNVIEQPIASQDLCPQSTDIILEATMITYTEDAEFGPTLTASNRGIVKCHMIFDLEAKNAKTGLILARRRCEGTGKATAENIRPLKLRPDSGTTNVFDLLMRELDETGYFKKAEAIALIKAIEPIFNDAAFTQVILSFKTKTE